jgi:hypothetical protein
MNRSVALIFCRERNLPAILAWPLIERDAPLPEPEMAMIAPVYENLPPLLIFIRFASWNPTILLKRAPEQLGWKKRSMARPVLLTVAVAFHVRE